MVSNNTGIVMPLTILNGIPMNCKLETWSLNLNRPWLRSTG